MKDTETKKKFIQLRAQGKPYSEIMKALKISKTTCIKFEKESKAEIDELKKVEVQELYESYGLAKEARIKKLGDTLNKINDALDKADFTKIDTAKLLELRLKYTEVLKAERPSTTSTFDTSEEITASGILTAIADLLNRVKAGEVTQDQAQQESKILQDLLKAFDTVEVKAKLDEIETLLEEQKKCEK